MYNPVNVIHFNSFANINSGYYVGNDSGFGIINGKGQVGDLVVNSEGSVGIVSQIGRDSDYGFMRVILWKDIKNIIRRTTQQKERELYLGLSVKSHAERNGVSVLRVAANSPFADNFRMGDTIVRVNNHSIRNPEDLTRSIMVADKCVVFEVEDPNRKKRIVNV
jgi:S1-C subfamily serine protease